MIPVRGSLFAFRLTGFFPGHLNHMSNKLEKGGFQQSILNGLLGRGNSSWPSRKTREIPFMFWLNSYRIVAPLENNCCSMVDRVRQQEHASMTRNCRSKNVEACSLATSQAGESGKCKIIKPLLVSDRHAPVSNNFSATKHPSILFVTSTTASVPCLKATYWSSLPSFSDPQFPFLSSL